MSCYIKNERPYCNKLEGLPLPYTKAPALPAIIRLGVKVNDSFKQSSLLQYDHKKHSKGAEVGRLAKDRFDPFVSFKEKRFYSIDTC